MLLMLPLILFGVNVLFVNKMLTEVEGGRTE